MDNNNLNNHINSNLKCQLCGVEKNTLYKIEQHFTKKVPCVKGTPWTEDNKKALLDDHLSKFKNLQYDNYLAKNNKTFNTKQLEFINMPLQSTVLVGIPGGGKTSTIIEFIYKKYYAGEITDKEFLITTFSKLAQEDFIKKGNDKTLFKKTNVRTIHSIAMSIVNKGKPQSKSQSQTDGLSTVIYKAYKMIDNCDVEIEEIDPFKDLKVIIIDEAQDINKTQYDLIKLIANMIYIPLILVGDPNQNIYQFQGGSDIHMLNHANNINSKIQLDVNYRSTPEIIKFANYFAPHKNTMVANVPGPNTISISNPISATQNQKPTILVDSLDNLKQFILTYIKTYKKDLSNLAIIGPLKKSNEAKFNIRLGLQYIANLLELKKIAYMQHYKDDKDDLKSKLDIKLGHINLLTIHGSKGLEFSDVILLNFQFNTMGRAPSKNQYTQYKYLWYVAITRAKLNLSILVDKQNPIWPGIRHVPPTCYTSNIKINAIKPPYFEMLNDMLIITDVVEDNIGYFNEKNLYEFVKKMNVEITKSVFSEELALTPPYNSTSNTDYTKYNKLFGRYAEAVYEFYYKLFMDLKKSTHHLLDHMNNMIKKYTNVIVVGFDKEDKKIWSYIENYYKKYGIMDNMIDLNNLKTENEKRIHKFLIYKMKSMNIYVDSIMVIKDLITVDVNYTNNIIKSWVEIKELYSQVQNPILNPILKHLFNIELQKYHYDYECKYMLYVDFITILFDSNHIMEEIIKFAKSNADRDADCPATFQLENEHPCFPIRGRLDIINNGLDSQSNIIELKYSDNDKCDIKWIVQTFLYYNNMFPKWNSVIEFEIWNLKKGVCYKINMQPTIKPIDLLYDMCDFYSMKMRGIFALDLETSGLNVAECAITERYVKEINLDYVISEGLIKSDVVLSQLVIDLTGITNNDIYQAKDTMANLKMDFEKIFKYFNKPTFIAHNGINFDFAILKIKGMMNKEDYKPLNFNIIISDYFNMSGFVKLAILYETIIKKSPALLHRAKADVILMEEIIQFGIKSGKFKLTDLYR